MTTEVETKPVRTNYSWTQPLCTDCWVLENSEPAVAVDDTSVGIMIREPARLKHQPDETFSDHLERCCKCVRWTTSRIFIRVDPASVPYPSHLKDD